MPAPSISTATAGKAQVRSNGQGLTETDLLKMYRIMVLSRTLDERAWILNRQGKAAIVPSSQGHEATQLACAWATDPTRDHYLIYYRQLPLLVALGVTPLELLKGFLAKEGEPLSGARQFPMHGAHPRVDAFSFSSVVGTQMPQAVGVALADKMRGESRVSVVFFGDGGSSQGDCHEAMNFAGIHKLPVIFLCENNRYAISVPIRKQVATESVAGRAASYGFPGVTVDGTDVEAVYEVMREAVERTRSRGGPVLIEAMIERIFPHTTDDDQTKYRSAEEIQRAKDRDPVPLLERKLRDRGILDDKLREQIWAEAKRAVNQANAEADAAPYPDLSTMYEGVYGTSFPTAASEAAAGHAEAKGRRQAA
ncbi:MAG: thiamine pyrophosphate-dependent dehydrogenase E1 component subunit alpha [Chloroflexi bacterium]|nr:thiamine pyrophosphate-dependent dehydrogenase E1 component subunit alpha [Chloroflexota bacterium]